MEQKGYQDRTYNKYCLISIPGGDSKMDFSVRKATERDYEGLSKIYTEVDLLHSQALPQIFATPKEPFRNREFISEILKDKNAAIIVAESSGEIIGLIHILIREAPDIPMMVKRRYAYIGEIAVAEEQRGPGIGKALMREAEQWAIRRKISQLEFNVWDFNKNAIAFFEKLGYTPSRHNMWKSV